MSVTFNCVTALAIPKHPSYCQLQAQLVFRQSVSPDSCHLGYWLDAGCTVHLLPAHQPHFPFTTCLTVAACDYITWLVLFVVLCQMVQASFFILFSVECLLPRGCVMLCRCRQHQGGREAPPLQAQATGGQHRHQRDCSWTILHPGASSLSAPICSAICPLGVEWLQSEP